MNRRIRCAPRALISLALLGAVGTPAGAQAAMFQPGARELFSLDLARPLPDGLPKGVTLLTGKPQFMDMDGVRMLKSVGPVEFLIQLTEALPARFTLEFDVVSRKTNVGGPEFAFEATPTLSRSPRSAQVAWSHQGMAIYGGGIDREFKLPEGMGTELMGQLSEIRVAFDGPASKLLTNSEVLYDLPNLPFPRGRVLRVFMHGVDENEGAFYLAKLRIAEGGGVATSTISAPTGPAISSGPRLVTPTTGLAAPGTVATIGPRTFALSGFIGAGNFTPIASRTFALSGFIGAGNFTPIASRAFALSGFTGAGNFAPIAPRAINLSGWTAVGLSINP